MGKIYLCQRPLSENPLYEPQTGCRICSAEELCYFIFHYYMLLDESFLNLELARFLRQELGLADLAVRVEKCNPAKDFASMLMAILRRIPYYGKAQLNVFARELEKRMSASPWETAKARGDFAASSGRYARAVRIYEEILAQGMGGDERTVSFVGRIYHNLAMVYMRLFRYEEARDALEEAYLLLEDRELLMVRWLLGKLCPGLEEEEALESRMTQKELEAVSARWQQLCREEADQAAPDPAESGELLSRWKEEYRRMAR